MARITIWNPTDAAKTERVSTAGFEEVSFSVVNPANLDAAIAITLEGGAAVFKDAAAVTLSATNPNVTLAGGPTYTFAMATPSGVVGLDAYASGGQGM